jgi:predicted house-cleaning noncanonical NTP pyrophosphatase (MazG superfamily)
LGKVSLDGTKIKANASKHHALSWEHAGKLEQQLQAEVKELLRLAEQADTEEVPAEMDIPAELCRRQDRLQAIRGQRRSLSNGPRKDLHRNKKNTKKNRSTSDES